MKIKTYRSPSIPRAVDLIKQELGPGAVILNTKRIKKRRFLGLVPSLAFEITAASEPQPERVSKRPNRGEADKKGVWKENPASSPGVLRAASTRSKTAGVRVPKQRIEVDLEVTSPPPEGGGFDLRLKSPKDLASDAGDSLDRLSHSARRPLP